MNDPNECRGVGCKGRVAARVWVTVCGVSYPVLMCSACADAWKARGRRVELLEKD